MSIRVLFFRHYISHTKYFETKIFLKRLWIWIFRMFEKQEGKSKTSILKGFDKTGDVNWRKIDAIFVLMVLL